MKFTTVHKVTHNIGKDVCGFDNPKEEDRSWIPICRDKPFRWLVGISYRWASVTCEKCLEKRK